MEQLRRATKIRNGTVRKSIKTKAVANKRSGPGRPPKSTKGNRVGRPKGSTTKKKVAQKNRDMTKALRARIADVNQQLKAAKAELKQKLKNERELVKTTQAELKEALKRERALIKLFSEKDRKLQSYGARWVKQEIEKIQAPPKKRRRRIKAA
jgi:hypothetical protein